MTTLRPPDALDDAEVMRLWRECELPEYFLGNGGSNHNLVEFARCCNAGQFGDIAIRTCANPAHIEIMIAGEGGHFSLDEFTHIVREFVSERL